MRHAPAWRPPSSGHLDDQLDLHRGVQGQRRHTDRRARVHARGTEDRAQELARICVLNALAAIRAEVGDLDRVRRVVKVVGFVASAPGFLGQPAVVNGASELLGQVFGDAGRHARSAVGVAVLPLDAPVEVEVVVEAG
jgi:enamine deaminase RidA (YjgF/YER057c/UK114 family)